jgi:quercetin dioxygenase-like cupin family protein
MQSWLMLVALLLSMVASALSGCEAPSKVSQSGAAPARATETAPERFHVSEEIMPWTTTKLYPEWFRNTYRYKELVGSVSTWQSIGGEWRGVHNPEIRMGALQLDAGAIYPFHAHPAPELYYVIKGTAEWTVGDETFVARSGTAVYTPSNTRHQMINTGAEKLELLFVWWAPGGDRSVLDLPSKMLEGWDRSPGSMK